MKLMNLGVAVIPQKIEKKQIGQVVVPDNVSVTRHYRIGVVAETGSGTKNRPMEVEPNDVIMYKNGDYCKSGVYEIISLEDILYVEAKKCANPECSNTISRRCLKYCLECAEKIFKKTEE